ncbi:hypothetical protein CF65_01651 [Aggregatibacter actinomycetemcomitans HK1651]|nr:hypothetical protein CF65_01651 [Aggregatibacter actinomycetemcomitans HK1651]
MPAHVSKNNNKPSLMCRAELTVRHINNSKSAVQIFSVFYAVAD